MIRRHMTLAALVFVLCSTFSIKRAAFADPTPGRAELSIKIEQLPTDVTTDRNGWKRFKLDIGGGRTVEVNMRPRQFAKLEDASKGPNRWQGVIAGQLGQITGGNIVLVESSVQVFERKQTPAPDAPPTPDTSE